MDTLDEFSKCWEDIFGSAGGTAGRRERVHSGGCADDGDSSCDSEIEEVWWGDAVVKVLG